MRYSCFFHSHIDEVDSTATDVSQSRIRNSLGEDVHCEELGTTPLHFLKIFKSRAVSSALVSGVIRVKRKVTLNCPLETCSKLCF